jgi:hypothetical protein
MDTTSRSIQSLLPPLYIAYQTELAEASDVFHNDIRKRY